MLITCADHEVLGSLLGLLSRSLSLSASLISPPQCWLLNLPDLLQSLSITGSVLNKNLCTQLLSPSNARTHSAVCVRKHFSCHAAFQSENRWWREALISTTDTGREKERKPWVCATAGNCRKKDTSCIDPCDSFYCFSLLSTWYNYNLPIYWPIHKPN